MPDENEIKKDPGSLPGTMPDRGSMTEITPPFAGAERSSRLSGPSPEPERRKMHLRPVWIVLILLLPCLALTFYYSQIVAPGSEDTDSFLPTTSYALVLLLINLDLIGFVVLLLLLSRNLIKAYFERRHRLFGSGFRTKLVAAFIGFSLIPTVLLAVVASGLVNKAVDVWFSDEIEQVMRDSYDVARMQHAGHITLAVNSARAISHEIYREDMVLT
jgi:two-component system nitrogen regulation sensor histidine kinase NtrY